MGCGTSIETKADKNRPTGNTGAISKVSQPEILVVENAVGGSNQIAPTLQGVSVSFLNDFCQDLRSHNLSSLKTCEVVTQVIVPRTSAKRCRFLDTLPPDSEAVGAHQYFVSHGWEEIFVDQVEKITKYVQGKRLSLSTTFVWLDIFAICQHPGIEQQADLGRLQEMVVEAQKTLLLLDNNGTALTRIWILFEIWKTCSAKSPTGLHIVVSQVDSDGLFGMWLVLDVRKARATVESDRIRILENIQQSMGTVELGFQIKEALVQSAQTEADEWPEDDRESLEYSDCLQKLAFILHSHGDETSAVERLKQALVIQRRVHGDNDEKLLPYLKDLASFSPNREECMEWSKEAMEITIRTKGENTAQHADAMVNLALQHSEAQEFEEVASLCERAVAIYDSLEGSEGFQLWDYDIVNAHTSLAEAYNQLEESEKAQKVLLKLLRIVDENKSLANPIVFHSIYTTMANVIMDEQPLKALEFHKNALQAILNTYQTDHLLVGVTYYNIGFALLKLKLYREALDFFFKSESVYQKNASEHHEDWSDLCLQMATCFDHLGDADKAVEYYRLGIEKSFVEFNDDFNGEPYTWLGECLLKNSRLEEAENAFSKAVHILVSDEECPEFERALAGLRETLKQLGRPENDAEKVLESARAELEEEEECDEEEEENEDEEA